MEIIKKILGVMLSLTKKTIALIKGESLDDLKKRLLAVLGALFAVVCVFKSAKALRKAKKAAKAVKAAKKVKNARKAHGKKTAPIKSKSKQKAKKGARSLIKKLIIKKLSA